MGKLIQFPIARFGNRRVAAAGVFTAFGELEALERGQLKLVSGCAGLALLVTLALQLVAG
jgi:hypothetical protein